MECHIECLYQITMEDDILSYLIIQQKPCHISVDKKKKNRRLVIPTVIQQKPYPFTLKAVFVFNLFSSLKFQFFHRVWNTGPGGLFYILLTDRLAVRISDRAHVYVNRCSLLLLYGSSFYSVDELLSQKNRKHYLSQISVTAVSFLIQIYSARIGKVNSYSVFSSDLAENILAFASCICCIRAILFASISAAFFMA